MARLSQLFSTDFRSTVPSNNYLTLNTQNMCMKPSITDVNLVILMFFPVNEVVENWYGHNIKKKCFYCLFVFVYMLQFGIPLFS